MLFKIRQYNSGKSQYATIIPMNQFHLQIIWFIQEFKEMLCNCVNSVNVMTILKIDASTNLIVYLVTKICMNLNKDIFTD